MERETSKGQLGPDRALLKRFKARIRQMDRSASAATKALGLPPEEQPSVLRAMYGQEIPSGDSSIISMEAAEPKPNLPESLPVNEDQKS